MRFCFAQLFPAVLLLASCAGNPQGVLLPLTGGVVVEGASTVDMLVATTREAMEDPSFLYSGERGPDLSLIDMQISIPPASARKVGEVQWPKRLPPNPAKEFATLQAEPLNVSESRVWLKEHLGPSRHVLVFVHGFNNRFEDSVFRFAQIVHDSGAQVAPILFTWPSRASVFDYNYDKESTNYSRDALEELLKAVANSKDVSEVTVMAHSMGTWLAVESLRQMTIRDGRIAPKIKNVILASPDIDIDVFRKQWQQFGDQKPKFTVFVSADDKALAISRLISGNRGRLGAVNPAEEPYKTEFERAGIDVVDLTKIDGADYLNHSKFAQSPQVVQLLGQRLINGQTMTDSRLGVGESIGAVAVGATQIVGHTASAAISIPIAVVDPETRRNLPGQFEAATSATSATLGAALPD
ncbi:alpha/beta fold hydrolase [Aureimonas fodinaquatilis]|uniref:Alpha/beta fold hydrolase n=1 Tax=Aureimonas fodinaquatilis TaxID=2565783 RepID=A0A5B0DX03_9HYPH|nr:alpha/beta hydrolase [Aureimonas fodinaquatilis]KAA0970341.1 alpha/beta fold hydrolase [Aureimonas fodinaquatilis]